jgi:hypothetical protein
LLRERGTKDRFTHVYFIGFVSRSEYDEHKYLEEKGEKENGANFFVNTWNLRFSRFHPVSAFPLGMIERDSPART